MSIIIDSIDFEEIEAEKYWSFPKTYKGNPKTETFNMIMSGNYIGSRKMDGAYFRLIKGMDGTMRLQSRSESVNGGYLDKYNWVPHLHPFFENLPNGTCLLGELYFPNNEGSRYVTTVMGCLEEKARARQESGEKLNYYIFDVWAWEGKSLMKNTAEARFNLLAGIENTHAYNHFEYVKFATYYIGPALWDELARVRSINGEGIVITKLDSIPAPGKRTARKTLKIKKEFDNPIDCFLTGKYKPANKDYKGDHIEEWTYWFNTHTYEKLMGYYYEDYAHGVPVEPVTKSWFHGWAGAIEIALMDGDIEVPIGWISGVTEEVKSEIVTSPEKYRHRVVKVNAMSIEPDTHALRHGKIVEWRAEGDKNWNECLLSQIL